MHGAEYVFIQIVILFTLCLSSLALWWQYKKLREVKSLLREARVYLIGAAASLEKLDRNRRTEDIRSLAKELQDFEETL